MTSVAETVAKFRLAEIVEVVLVATATLVIVKIALVLPGAKVTDAGTADDVELEDNLMTRSLEDGAGPESVIVPVECAPPTRVLGLSTRETITGAPIVNLAVAVVVPYLAVITADLGEATIDVVTGNVAVEAPAAMVMDVGTFA